MKNDPKDLRDLTFEQLSAEANHVGSQLSEWTRLFDVESAIRCHGNDQISDLDKYSILSNRWLILDRERLTEYRLHDSKEVLKMVQDAYHRGYSDHEFNSVENVVKGIDKCKDYMEKFYQI